MAEKHIEKPELLTMLNDRLGKLRSKAVDAERLTLEGRLDQYISELKRLGVPFSEEEIRQRSEVRYGKFDDVVAQMNEQLKRLDQRLSLESYQSHVRVELTIRYQGLSQPIGKFNCVVWENDGGVIPNPAEAQLIMINFPTMEDILVSIADSQD